MKKSCERLIRRSNCHELRIASDNVDNVLRNVLNQQYFSLKKRAIVVGGISAIAYCAKFVMLSGTPRLTFVRRVLLNAALFLVGVAVIGMCWFFLYSNDILNFDTLSRFAPSTPTREVGDCAEGSISVVPYSLIGQNVINAARAAEGDQTFARQIAFSLYCDGHMTMLRRHVLEYRASVQVQRRFSAEQLLTIYLNRAYFGDGGIGIENAAQHYYGKHCSELDVSQSAMIAGLLKAPNMYSPERHPDRAKTRRDEVLTEMVSRGFLSPVEAEAAMQSPVR